MQIREAKIEDVKPIAIIMDQVQKLHSQNRTDVFIEKNINELEKQVIEAINDDERIILVAENDIKEIVGILIYKIRLIESNSNLKPCKILHISELGVEEKQRNKGIGKMLINEAEKIKEKLGCGRLELNCWGFNKNAIAFYKACGMKIQRIFFEIN